MTDTFARAHRAWFEDRLARLTAEDGWLNLAGRWWITPGRYRIGSGAGADIPLERAPEHLGTLEFGTGDRGRYDPAEGAPVDLDRAEGRFCWRDGDFLMEITTLNERRALRIRDAALPRDPGKIAFFPLDPALRITARWEDLPEPMDLVLDTVIGIPTRVPVTRRAIFDLGGQEVAFLPTYGTADRPQFVFRDLTSLDETYPKARFVFGEEVSGDRVVIDFNRAINPPCAFTPHAVCPLPPRENLLPLRVEAGEKRLAPRG
ncbi:DUF1684 domain-containing protein [Celeribacter indicus]|uniref:Lipoprotein n=1 Tax=Celeribacter indicus TaxID=1208324 RepID=A0A0B5DXI7_9RHOB|nr:DUF1684 domain-containing protein [Celeribacter indicus]AJE45815.1 lipoprotein [Celeribacter indicus]SDW61341.1 hypothetical protein SAMN05443573_10543 [Celeribacter indicus]